MTNRDSTRMGNIERTEYDRYYRITEKEESIFGFFTERDTRACVLSYTYL